MRLLQRLTRLEPLQLSKRKPLWARSCRTPFVGVLVVVSLTSALGHRFYNSPRLDIGRDAPQTIAAPESVTVEDTKATEEKRKEARSGSISVLMLDSTANQETYRDLRRLLDQGTEVRQIAGSFPFANSNLLSLRSQGLLRKLPEADWQAVLSASTDSGHTTARQWKANDRPLSTEQRQIVSELQRYRRVAGAEQFFALVQTIAQTRYNYTTAIDSLPQPANDQPALYDAAFLEISDSDWKQTQLNTLQVAEQMLAQGIAPGLSKTLLQEAVRLQLRDRVPKSAEPLAAQLLLRSLQPNLIRDEEQTRLRAEKAAQDIQPEWVSVRRGEPIVQMGQKIDSRQFALLDRFGLSRRGIDWMGLTGFGVLVAAAVGIGWVLERRFHPKMRQRDRLLLCLLTVTTPVLIALRVPSTNLPAVGLLVSTFYGSPMGITVTSLLTLLLPIGITVNWTQWLSSAAGGMLCAGLAGRLRSREELSLLGLAVGVLQGGLYLLLNVASGVAWYTLLGTATIHALLGLAWCIVAIGMSPYLEQMFDLVTPIRLAELANPNRPLLKRLAAEAPGTFQHTLFVATLAEAAARALGCNVELVRTGTLYHDIGKMHDPLGFIENQMGGPNKHDAIDDPWKSADIIKKHVSEGLVMARKFRLPKVVQAFIPEHQGTMLIAYFYHQAQQRAAAGGQTIVEADFRYDGPAPQSRETGIVMVADSCEAALRSLKDATPEEALAMINKILRARWQDGQLSHSGLTREELSEIATIFVQVWQQFNHQRIAYPKLSAPKASTIK